MKDRFNNELAQGDLVEVDIPVQYIIGRVIQIKRGGVAIAPNVVTPDVLILACEFIGNPPNNQSFKALRETKGPSLIKEN